MNLIIKNSNMEFFLLFLGKNIDLKIQNNIKFRWKIELFKL